MKSRALRIGLTIFVCISIVLVFSFINGHKRERMPAPVTNNPVTDSQINDSQINDSPEPNEEEYEDSDYSVNDSQLTEVPEGYIGIYNADDFDYIQSSPQYNYILMNDIDFKDYSGKWKSASIEGVFEGNYHSIKNYTNSEPLFFSAYQILNLNMENVKITEANSAVCSEMGKNNAYYETDYKMSNVHVFGEINCSVSTIWQGGGETIGGICHNAECAELNNCSFDGNIKVKVINEDQGALDLVVGGITGTAGVGTAVIGCYNSGSISVSSKGDTVNLWVGGICGVSVAGYNHDNPPTIQSCGNKMSIKGETVNGSYGGIVGKNDGGASVFITKCYNNGSITSTGKQKADSQYSLPNIGGILGEGSHYIVNCYNRGTISGGGCAGGIVGNNGRANLVNTYNTGSVSTDNKYFYDSKYHVGALIGDAYNAITDGDYGTIENCYYTNNDIGSAYGNPKLPYVHQISKDEAKQQSTFVGFDFSNEWEMGSGDYPYPVLTGLAGQ